MLKSTLEVEREKEQITEFIKILKKMSRDEKIRFEGFMTGIALMQEKSQQR